jgi:hypothetical protein
VADPGLAKKVSSKRPLVWLALVSIAPFVASFALYFWLKPTAQMNYGTLLSGRSLPPIVLEALSGERLPADALRGKWALITVDPVSCADACARKLYATRQARAMQGKERERVVRLWLAEGQGALPAGLTGAHPDLLVAKAVPALVAALPAPGVEESIFLVDPLGNVILRYPADPDIKRLHQDLVRLLYASRIG